MGYFKRKIDRGQSREEIRVRYERALEAEMCTRRIWDLVWILREHGRHVELPRVANPGRLVYEDEYQVAAVPWTEATHL